MELSQVPLSHSLSIYLSPPLSPSIISLFVIQKGELRFAPLCLSVSLAFPPCIHCSGLDFCLQLQRFRVPKWRRCLVSTASPTVGDDVDDEFADLYIVKWSSLMIPPITIMMTNVIAIAVGFSRTIYSVIPQWSRLIGGVFFSFWVLAHLYPFAKGLMGRRGRAPTIVFVWSGLIAITISLLWVAIKPPSGSSQIGGSFQFP